MCFFLVPITMYDKKLEQWTNVKFLVELKKSLAECFKLLKGACGENSLSRVCTCFRMVINGFLKVERAPKMTNVQLDLSLF